MVAPFGGPKGVDWRRWPKFKKADFECKCGCGSNLTTPALLDRLTLISDHFGQPVKINSGTRCKEHNARVGGAKGSLHLTGEAADIVVEAVPPIEVYRYASQAWPDEGGVGQYATFTHVDIRPNRARW